MTLSQFELSRIYGRGWNDGKKALSESSEDVEKIEGESINPYQSPQERQRWATGFSEALRSKRPGRMLRRPTTLESKPEREAMATAHRFRLGQQVTITESMFERRAAKETFTISRLLPIENGIAQYRVQSSKDKHERVVVESRLIELPSSDRVFSGAPAILAALPK
jgi:hypothetical protein